MGCSAISITYAIFEFKHRKFTMFQQMVSLAGNNKPPIYFRKNIYEDINFMTWILIILFLQSIYGCHQDFCKQDNKSYMKT